MKLLILKTSLFVLPALLIYNFNKRIYRDGQGDLIRAGYVYDNPSPRDAIDALSDLEKQYSELSAIDLKEPQSFDVFTIGDSFSDQDRFGYQNFLAQKNLSVLNLTKFLNGRNPIQRTIELINGDFFDRIQVKIVVLQTIERSTMRRCATIDFDRAIAVDSLASHITKRKLKGSYIPKKVDLFSHNTLRAPLINLQYSFHPNPAHSKTCVAPIAGANLFTNDPNRLLFYYHDLTRINRKNDKKEIDMVHDVLTKLNAKFQAKGIQLIVMVCPDKYDIYYPFIKDKENFVKPTFFDYYNGLNKEYVDAPVYDALMREVGYTKDLYYFDDSHWSSVGASLAAEEVYKMMLISGLK
ncbi:MAG: hypothetical protein AAGI23_16205 [Bacteroidota bacterium]